MNSAPIVIRFDSLIRPDVRGFRASLAPYADWQPENITHIPIRVEWPIEVRARLDYLRDILDGRIAWPPGVSFEAQRWVRSLAEDIVGRLETEVVAGAGLILSVGDLGGSRRGELTGDETEALLDLYISAKAMALVRLLLAFRLVSPSDPQWRQRFYHLHADPHWMRQFYHLHVSWGYAAIDGLPYVIHDRGDDVLYWTDADAWNTGVVGFGDRYRVYVPGTVDIVDGTNPLNREHFLRYIAPQLVERLARCGVGGSDLAGWARTPRGWFLSMRHETFIDLTSFDTQPWSNIRHGHAGTRAKAIHQHVLGHLQALIEQGRLRTDRSKGFRELERCFKGWFPLQEPPSEKGSKDEPDAAADGGGM